MTTSVSDTQRLRGESTNGTISATPETAERPRTRPANQLDFLQAMRDFKFMFPTMEEEVIEAVLRANNGIVDATVDQLLTMSVDLRDYAENPEENVDEILDTHQLPPTTINGVKLKPSHTVASNDALFREVFTPNSGPVPQVASNAVYRVDEDENLLLSLDSAVPDVPAVNPPVPPPPTSQPVVNGLPLLIDAPISDFLQGLPAYHNNPLDNSRPNQLSLATTVPSPISSDGQQTVTPVRPPKAVRQSESVPVAPTKVRSDADSVPAGPVRRLRAAWNPPLLGNLPDDFLRVMPDNRQPPPLPAKMGHHHHHTTTGSSLQPSSRTPSTAHNTGARDHHRSHHHQRTPQRVSPIVEPNVTRTFSEIRHQHGSHGRAHTPTGGAVSGSAGLPYASNGTAGGVQHISRSHTYKPSSSSAHRQHENGGLHPTASGSSVRSSPSSRKMIPATQTPVSHLGQGQGHRTLQSHNSGSHHVHDATQMNDMGDVISPYLRHKMAENERRLQDADLDPELMQMLRDERLALVLQNEEFLAELRNDKDFLRVLEKDRLNATAFEPASTGDGDNSRESDEPSASATPGNVNDANAEFRRQLKYMGGSSRKTLMAKAKQFFSRKKRTPRPVLIKGPMGVSTMHLLDDEDAAEDGGINQLALVMDDEDGEEADQLPAVPQHATVQRPLNSSDVIVTRSHATDVC